MSFLVWYIPERSEMFVGHAVQLLMKLKGSAAANQNALHYNAHGFFFVNKDQQIKKTNILKPIRNMCCYIKGHFLSLFKLLCLETKAQFAALRTDCGLNRLYSQPAL